jgi:hypothetical protein
MLDLLPELAAMDLDIRTCMELIIPQSKLSLTGNFLNAYIKIYQNLSEIVQTCLKLFDI